MDRYGENIKKDEGVMVIIIIVAIILFLTRRLFLNADWKVINFVGVKVPYHIGFSILVSLLLLVLVFKISAHIGVIIYFLLLWTTGFIDDRFGTKYPKGLKGHLFYFYKSGRISTGLIKLITTVLISLFLSITLYNGIIYQSFISFLLLVLAPHVMNLFDTRPLRVWKVIGLHSLLLLPTFFLVSIELTLITIGLISLFVFVEGKQLGMLGDNGATLLGGILSIIVIHQLPLSLQIMLLTFYSFIILVAEKISISEWIDKNRLIKMIDRFGVTKSYR